jgi:hypothetical protein
LNICRHLINRQDFLGVRTLAELIKYQNYYGCK